LRASGNDTPFGVGRAPQVPDGARTTCAGKPACVRTKYVACDDREDRLPSLDRVWLRIADCE
jgi:hypothetical protein